MQRVFHVIAGLGEGMYDSNFVQELQRRESHHKSARQREQEERQRREQKERQDKERLAASVAALPPSADFPAWAGGRGQVDYDDSGLGVEF
mmetsp:Transcript_19519/g.35300  ORF Transcript_19519/g.35300 Transcript_19519/m.35300 type:complete len:91 (-) Transcript_19519:23-295(-)